MAPGPSVDSAPNPRPPGLTFALIGHPTVALLRFAAKLALAWFLLPADYGEVVLAGSLTFVAGHLALLGLDEAWIHARHPGPRLLAELQRVHRRSGLATSALLAVVGALLAASAAHALLGRLLLALAPMVWFANLSVLPTALLVRARQYRRLFAIDVGGVLAWAGVSLTSAALGSGPWCLVHGWYANAAVTVLCARRLARSRQPAPCAVEDDLPRTLRFGRHLAAADLTDFAAERAGGVAVGFGIGRAALGLYEQGLHVASVMVSYARQLSERALLPILSDSHRRDELPGAHRQALRVALLYVVPAHGALAFVAGPIVRRLLPPAWHGAAPLAEALTLAAAAHCVGLVSSTALKAGDWSRTVARLGLVRLALLAAALGLTLPGGEALAVAWGLAAAQIVAALCAVSLALQRLGPEAGEAGTSPEHDGPAQTSPEQHSTDQTATGATLGRHMPFAARHAAPGRALPHHGGVVPGRVSVVVATFNGRRFVAETLRSVLAQSWPDVQLIVCDDGSSDGTRELLADFDGPLTVVHQDNAGVSSARNRGATLATGEWLAFLDHDDLWEADMLERQLACLATRPDAGLVYADSQIIDEEGTIRGQRSDWLDFRDGEVAAELLSGNFIPIETVVLRSELFRELGGFDESLRYLEDYDLFLRIAACRPVLFQPQPIARYRVHGSNLSRQHEALLREWVEVLERLARSGRERPAAVRALIEGERARRAGEVAWAALRRGDLEAAEAWIVRAGERCPAALHSRLLTWRALLVGLPAPWARGLRRVLPKRRLYGV